MPEVIPNDKPQVGTIFRQSLEAPPLPGSAAAVSAHQPWEPEVFPFNGHAPGGQHAGPGLTGVIAFDRITRVGVVCADERSQHKNRLAAIALLPRVRALVGTESPVPFDGTREQLHARISDVLRRSGVSDAEQLIRAMECDAAAFLDALETAWGVIANVTGDLLEKQDGDWREAADRWHNETFLPTIAGREIGPAKPASEQAE